jgi:hypothetical protein
MVFHSSQTLCSNNPKRRTNIVENSQEKHQMQFQKVASNKEREKNNWL